MKSPNRRKVIWGAILVLLVAAVLTKDLSTTLLEVLSPNRQLAARISQTAGWGSFFSHSKYRVELLDLKTQEHVQVMEQPVFEGWNTYRPEGIEWLANSRHFRCHWWTHGSEMPFFTLTRVERKPLRAKAINSSKHPHL